MLSTSARPPHPRPAGERRLTSPARRLALVPAALALLASTACSSAEDPEDSTGPADPTTGVAAGAGESGGPEESGTPTVTPEPAGTSASPLELSGGGTTEVCAGKAFPRDLAFLDVTWEAGTDLEFFELRVDAPQGLRQVVADTRTIPPRNFGGRISVSGLTAWADRDRTLRSSQLALAGGTRLSEESPIQGATGLAVLRIKLDEDALDSARGASFTGISATYRTVDGETGTVTEPSEVVFRAKGRC